MKKILIVMVLMVVATVSKANDSTISGYFLNTSNKTTVKIFKNGVLIKEKTPVFKFYKLKLKEGTYTVVFDNGINEKRMYITLNKFKKNVQIDVDYQSKTDVAIRSKGERIEYKKIDPRKAFE